MTTVREVISKEKSYLQDHFRIDKALLNKLECEELLSPEYTTKISKEIEAGKDGDALTALLEYIEKFYVIETLKKFCTCLRDNSSRKPKWKEVAMKILDAIPSDEGLLDSEEVSEEDSEEECEDVGTRDTDEEESMPKCKKPQNSDIRAMVKDGIKDGFQEALAALLQGTKVQGQKPNTSEITSRIKGKHKKGSSRNKSVKENERKSGTSTCKKKAETKTEIVWKLYSTPFKSTCRSATGCDDAVYVMAKGDKMKADKIYTCNQSTKVWTEIEEPPGSVTSFSIASLGNDLYLTGGKVKSQTKSKTTSKQVLTWNIKQQKWEAELPDMQEGRFCHGSGSFSDYLVVAGGIDTYSIEIINCKTVVENKGWVKVISLPKSLVWPYVAASNKHLYFGFGCTDDIFTPSNYLAALTQDELVEAFKSEKTMDIDCIEKLPLPPHELPALAVIGNKPLALGGRTIDEKHKPESSVSECYTLVDHKEWDPLQEMESSRCSACVATVSDGIVVMGGTTITPRVSYHQPQSSTCSAVEKAQFV